MDYEDIPYLKIPNGDFVIFDEKLVVQNHYDSLGKAIKMDFYNDTDDISYYLKLRKELVSKAVKFH